MTLRALLALAAAAFFAACSSGAPPARAPSPDEAPVVRAAEALFAAMESRDTAALRRMFVPEARLVAVLVREGEAPVARSSTVADFVASVGQSTERLRERMWEPRVEVRGDFASLWAPYAFHLDERFSHCGVDAFHFVRAGGEWRIAALSYTVQTEGCPTPPAP